MFRIRTPVPPDPLWTAKQDSISLRGQVGLPGIRQSIGLARWWHLGLNTLWLLNGLAFYVLLFVTPQWKRLVPTSWSVLPDTLSTAIQYLSLDWPQEHGWVAYNGLQVLHPVAVSLEELRLSPRRRCGVQTDGTG